MSLETPEIIDTCYHLNPKTESRNFKGLILILIPSYPPRARSSAASPRELGNPRRSRLLMRLRDLG
jgi:hypothetical protein